MMQTDNSPPVVLVVEDEALLRWHASELLVTAGYSVLEADDAASALRVLEARSDVRMIFTDIAMPGELDGIALAARVHARWPHILLVVTSNDPRIADADLPDHGLFVPKPYRDTEVVGTVGRLFSDQRSGRLGPAVETSPGPHEAVQHSAKSARSRALRSETA